MLLSCNTDNPRSTVEQSTQASGAAANALQGVSGEKLLYIRWNGNRTASDIAMMNTDGTGRETLTQIGAINAQVSDLEYTHGSSYLGFVSSLHRGRTRLHDNGFIMDLRNGHIRMWPSEPPAVPAATRRMRVVIKIFKSVSALFLAVKGNPKHQSLGGQAAGTQFSLEVDVPANDPSCWIVLFSSYGVGDSQDFDSGSTRGVELSIGPHSKGLQWVQHFSPSASGARFCYSYAFQNQSARIPFNSVQSQLADGQSGSFATIGRSFHNRSTLEPVLSPDERMLAYCHGDQLSNSLYVTTAGNPTGGDLIAQGGLDMNSGMQFDVTSPAWSPDGRRLACVIASISQSNLAIQANVFVVNRDGSGLRQLTQLPVNMIAQEPSFSSDGRTIAFSVFSSSKNFFTLDEAMFARRDIGLVSLEGGDQRFLTRDGVSSNPCFVRFSGISRDANRPRPR
jgi:hypothetical protein